MVAKARLKFCSSSTTSTLLIVYSNGNILFVQCNLFSSHKTPTIGQSNSTWDWSRVFSFSEEPHLEFPFHVQMITSRCSNKTNCFTSILSSAIISNLLLVWWLSSGPSALFSYRCVLPSSMKTWKLTTNHQHVQVIESDDYSDSGDIDVCFSEPSARKKSFTSSFAAHHHRLGLFVFPVYG